VDERGGLQAVPGPLTVHTAVGDHMKLRLERYETSQRVAIAGTPRHQQLRDTTQVLRNG